jgi:thiol-disulfide isomerase/thioredoxin
VQRLISFSPSEEPENERETLQDYDWNLLQMNSETRNFSQSKGKVVLVNYWATWCPPCVAEMPSLQKLYNTYGDKVDFYFITSEKPAKVKSFLKKNEYTLPVYFKIFDAPKKLKSKVLPTTYVISKTGEIVVSEEGTADWNSKKTKQLLDGLLAD